MMQSARLDLLDHAYVDDLNARWAVKPSSMIVMEFAGSGDPAFGGSADDRPLGVDGQIHDRRSKVATAEFPTIEAAHAAAKAIPNRRPGSVLGVLPTWARTDPDIKPGLYYVSVVRSGRDWRPLAGPFENDHAKALSLVDPARKLAIELDPRAHWYAYGTVRIDARENPPVGIFNDRLSAGGE